MYKVIQLIAEFPDGSTELYGEFETEEQAISKADYLIKVLGIDMHFWLKTVLRGEHYE